MQAWKGIRHHQRKVIVLIILQIILFGLVMGGGLYSQFLIFTDIQGIVEPLQRANYDAAQLQEGNVFTPELATVYESYIALQRHIVWILVIVLGIILILNGALWILSHDILQKGTWKEWGYQWITYAGLNIVVFSVFLGGSYFLLRSFVAQGMDPTIMSNWVKGILYTFGVVYYLLLVGFGLLPRHKWKEFFKRWGKILIQKFHKTLVVAVINAIVLAVMLGGLYWSLIEEWPVGIMLAFMLGIVVVLVGIRLFWIAALQEVAHETHHS